MRIKKTLLIVIILIVIMATCCFSFACTNNIKIEKFYDKFCKSESMRINYTITGPLFRVGQQNCLSFDKNKYYAMTDGEEFFAEVINDKMYTYMLFGGEWTKSESSVNFEESYNNFEKALCQLLNFQNYDYDKDKKEYTSKKGITIVALDMELEMVTIKVLKNKCSVIAVTTLATEQASVEITILDLNNVEINLPIPTVTLPMA